MKVIIILLLFLAVGVAVVLPLTGQPLALTLPVIDAHIHAEFTGALEPTSGIEVSQAQLLREMKENGVVGAISHTHRFDAKGYVDLSEHNISQCAGVGGKIPGAALENALKSKRFGCIKIYLGYVHQFASHPNYNVVYQLAKKYKVPVVFHTGDTYTSDAKLKYADPLSVDEVAVDNPDVKFVIAHLGNPWISSAAEVAYKNPNVYVEGSAIMIGNLDKVANALIDEFLVTPLKWSFKYIEDPKKVLFGTDWPLTGMAAYIRAYQKAIPKEHWRKVFYENALEVFPGLLQGSKKTSETREESKGP